MPKIKDFKEYDSEEEYDEGSDYDESEYDESDDVTSYMTGGDDEEDDEAELDEDDDNPAAEDDGDSEYDSLYLSESDSDAGDDEGIETRSDSEEELADEVEELSEDEAEELSEGMDEPSIPKPKRKPKRKDKCYLDGLRSEPLYIENDNAYIYKNTKPVIAEPGDRISDPIMTKYEMTRILGERASAIEKGAPLTIKGADHLPPAQVAYLELIAGTIPMIVARPLPRNIVEHWPVSELELIHEIDDPFFVPKDFDEERFLSMNGIKK